MSTEKNVHDMEAVFTAKVNSLKSLYTSSNNSIIVSHTGAFDQDKINSIAGIIENKLEQIGFSKKLIKKVFNIIIETLQNINIHGERDEKNSQLTYFLVGKKENECHMHSGNLVKPIQVEKLNVRLNAIKSLNMDDLKTEYMNVLSNGELSAKGGAGLGFITIALKSDNNIDFEFETINKNYSLFSLHSTVKD